MFLENGKYHILIVSKELCLPRGVKTASKLKDILPCPVEFAASTANQISGPIQHESESRCGLSKGKLCMRIQRREMDIGCRMTMC